MNGEKASISKETVVAYFELLSRILTHRIRKTTKNLNQDARNGQDSNRVHSECKFRMSLPHKTALYKYRYRRLCSSLPWLLIFCDQGPVLTKEVSRSSKTLVTTCKTTRRHNPEDHNRRLHCRENLRSQIYQYRIAIPVRRHLDA
jgi:hypothetical protein